MNNPTPQVKSAQRVLELLEFFAEERRPCSVGEISRSLGYPQSSTSVLLKSLALAGYLDHDTRSGLYIPNVRIALITAWIHDRLYSEQHLLHLMEQVLTKTGHTVMIGCRKDIHVRYLHVLQSTREGRSTARRARCFSAACPNARWLSCCARPMRRPAAQTSCGSCRPSCRNWRPSDSRATRCRRAPPCQAPRRWPSSCPPAKTASR